MTRRLLNLLTLLSLLLCVAVVAMWVRSYPAGETLQRLTATRKLVILSKSGGVGFECYTGEFDPGDAVGAWEYYGVADGPLIVNEHWWGRLGFDVYRGDAVTSLSMPAVLLGTGELTSVAIPWWALALTMALLPCIRAVSLLSRIRRQARLRPRLCSQCGYDLRATPGRCPECGTIAAIPPAA